MLKTTIDVPGAWCTAEHFTDMYDNVYDSFVESGIAEKLEEDKMNNEHGVKTNESEKMFGRATKYRMVDPENLLFVDETGCNTNMKDDGLIGGERHVLPTDDKEDAGVTGAVTDNHFTVLCFTNGLGAPVLCAIILKSQKDITEVPISWKLGIYIRKEIIDGEDMSECNFGEGKSMQGGPMCTNKGKEIPCFIGCSPCASITSELLTAMLSTIDKHNDMDCSNGKKPVLLLNGHHSPFEVPFVQYIHDDNHPWTLCLGVPYGTHLWQVADSPEVNGCFKIAIAKTKRDYLKYKSPDDQKFVPTDIFPIMNTAWERSFACSEYISRAIIKRGWGPLNYVLLDHPKLGPCVTTENNTTTTTTTENRSEQLSTTVTDTSRLTSLNDDDEVPEKLVLEVNTTGETYKTMLDCLMDETARRKGSTRRKEERN